MVSFSLARISHNYERKLRDCGVTAKSYRILDYLCKMHTLYCSASMRNTCFSNVSFIHHIFNCPMTPNWWQLQLVVNQSEMSQKPLQPYFSFNCFTVIPFHAYHLSSSSAYWACSILQYTSNFLTSWFSFSDPAGCKWHNSKQWRHILLLNLPSGLTGHKIWFMAYLLSQHVRAGSMQILLHVPIFVLFWPHPTVRHSKNQPTHRTCCVKFIW